mgnify:FL=1
MGDRDRAGPSSSGDVDLGFRHEANSAEGGSAGGSTCSGATGAISATKRVRGVDGAFRPNTSPADTIITESACVVCYTDLEPRGRASFWGQKPSRIGETWVRACRHELYCWECAKRSMATLADVADTRLRGRCPSCRAEVVWLRRGFDASDRGRKPCEEVAVADLRARRAVELAAALEVGRADTEREQLVAEQAQADAEAALEMHEDEEEQVAEAERRVEARALQRAWARAEAEVLAADAVRRLEGLGARVVRELRTDWQVWLLACAYAGRLGARMTAEEAKAAAQDAMREGTPLLHWGGGAHGTFLYGLAREYGRGARRRGGESSRCTWMVGLLEANGLRETVQWITGEDASDERATVEVLLGARLVACKCIAA